MIGCIEWLGAKNDKGYGRRRFQGKMYMAHRAAWIEVYGVIPDGMFVLHRCDNPPCINPEHLFLGTNQNNINDKMTKGRWNGGRKKQESCKRGHLYKDHGRRTVTGYNRCRKCINDRARETYVRIGEQ